MKLRFWIAVLAALAASGAIAQQKMYKSVMPDGKVIYSEKPEPNAKRVETVDAPPTQTGVQTLTPQDKARAEKMKREQTVTTKQDNTLDEARRQLKDAQALKERGEEPGPSERSRNANGTTRLNDSYWARQKSLDENIEKARKRVQELEGR